MTEKFRNKYRLGSARAFWCDYRRNAVYFVTICTMGREKYFGRLSNNAVILSKIGEIASASWKMIPDHFRNTEISEFVIMPDHVHGIIIIGKAKERLIGGDIPDNNLGKIIRGGGCTGKYNPMHHLGLARIIRWYKGRVTFYARKEDSAFAWQPRYHDHVIRDPESLEIIREYISTNPANAQPCR
jgi:putative transposase